jgi:hypothetical protein
MFIRFGFKMSKVQKIKLMATVLKDRIFKKIIDKNIPTESYAKIAKRNFDYFDDVLTSDRNKADFISIDSANDFVFRDIVIVSRDVENHQVIVEKLKDEFGIKNSFAGLADLNKHYNIDSFLALKSRGENKIATANENRLLAISKKNCILPSVSVERYEDVDGERVLVAKGGIKAIGVAFPTAAMFEFEYDEVYLINSIIINDVWGSKGINFGAESTAKENLDQILNYTESDSISDLHFKLYNENVYSFTARQKTKLIKVGDGAVSINTTNDLINQVLYRSNRETQVDDGKEVRSLLVQTLNNGVTRNFRVHMKESTYNNVRGKSVSIRRLPREEELKSLEDLGYSSRAVRLT